jgi:hypothetical protein
MLNAQAKAAAATEEPARRSVPEVVLDGRSWRCVADPIRNRGRSSGQPASWCGSEVVAEAILLRAQANGSSIWRMSDQKGSGEQSSCQHSTGNQLALSQQPSWLGLTH